MLVKQGFVKRGLVLGLVLSALAVPVLAAGGDVAEVPGAMDALKILASGMGTGFVLSFLMEKFSFFQSLDSEVKYWLIFGLSVGLPVLAQVLLEFVPPEAWARIDPYWRALAVGFVGWAGSQFAHQYHKGKQVLSEQPR